MTAMELKLILLHLLAFNAGITSWFIITTTNIVYSVFCLVLLFTQMAIFLFIITTEFFPLLLLGLYAGALAVLFIFVVMMIYIKKEEHPRQKFKKPILCFVILYYIFLFKYNGFFINYKEIPNEFDDYVWFIPEERAFWYAEIQKKHDLENLGAILYTYYFPYLLTAGLILLVALIGAITLTFRKTKVSKKQMFYQQSRRAFENSIYQATSKENS